MTYLQTIIAGDSWGQIAVPLLEQYPWTAFVFIPTFATVQLGLMNVIQAVIVDKQSQVRESDLTLQTVQRSADEYASNQTS